MTTRGREDTYCDLGTWLMIGLAVDGWAHHNLAQLETFFTRLSFVMVPLALPARELLRDQESVGA